MTPNTHPHRIRARSTSSIPITPTEHAAEFDRVFQAHLSFREIAQNPNIEEQCALTVHTIRGTMIQQHTFKDNTERPRMLRSVTLNRNSNNKNNTTNTADEVAKNEEAEEHVYVHRPLPTPSNPNLYHNNYYIAPPNSLSNGSRTANNMMNIIPPQAHILTSALDLTSTSLDILILTSPDFVPSFTEYLANVHNLSQKNRNRNTRFQRQLMEVAQNPKGGLLIAKALLREYAVRGYWLGEYVRGWVEEQAELRDNGNRKVRITGGAGGRGRGASGAAKGKGKGKGNKTGGGGRLPKVQTQTQAQAEAQPQVQTQGEGMYAATAMAQQHKMQDQNQEYGMATGTAHQVQNYAMRPFAPFIKHPQQEFQQALRGQENIAAVGGEGSDAGRGRGSKKGRGKKKNGRGGEAGRGRGGGRGAERAKEW